MRDFLIELHTEYDNIAQNQIGLLESGMSADEVLEKCKSIVKNLREYRRRTDEILKNQLYPMLNEPEKITEQDEQDLFTTAQKLSAFEERVDPGLALRIYQGLLEWARKTKDENKIIKYLYWCGITQHFFSRGRAHDRAQWEKISEYFNEGSSYEEKYDTFEDPETRKYIHRCMGNRSMVCYYIDEPELAMELEESCFSFWNGLIFAGKDLDFPWLSYFLACLNHRHTYVVRTAHSEPDLLTIPEQQEILDLSMTINKLYHTNKSLFSTFGGSRYDFHLWEAQFLSGLISFDILCDNVSKRKAEFSPDDYSSDALYARFMLNSFLMFYAAKMHKLKDKREEVITKGTKEAIHYFSSIPKTVSSSIVSENLQLFTRNLSDIFNPSEQLDFVLKMTTFRHIPTCAHSIIVGKIASFLTRRLIDTVPNYFIGCMGIKNADEARLRVDELCNFAEYSGLCHDVGKISYFSNPFLLTRILTAEEFEIIMRHPEDGALMLMREDGDSINSGYIDIIRGHHRYFDNSEGYPEDFDTSTSQYKVFIDIIAVANTLDAATDDISKTYNRAKPLEDICIEIFEKAGTRYSPVIAHVLEDDTVRSSLSRILDEDRKDAYYKAYLNAWEVEGRNYD